MPVLPAETGVTTAPVSTSLAAWVDVHPSPGNDQTAFAVQLISYCLCCAFGKGLNFCLVEEEDASGKDSFCGVACQEARQRSGTAL